AEVQRGRRRYLPTVFDERIAAPIAQIHLWNAGLTLLDGRQTQKHAGEPGAGSVVESEFGCVSVGVLIEAAVLEKSPHRPRVPMKIATHFDSMASTLPCESIPEFIHRVPGMHGRSSESVSDSGVALRGKPRSAPGVWPAESDSLDA